MAEILEKLIEVAPLLPTFFQEDIGISIADLEKYLYVRDGKKIKIPVNVGAYHADLGYMQVNKQIIESRESVINIVPKEIAGICLRNVISPVIDSNNEVVGFFSMTTSIERESQIEHASENLMSALEKINLSVQNIEAGSRQLSERIGSIKESAMLTKESVKLETKAIELIQQIASQSNLLGINAAIEAARVDAKGHGFAVVASEMRKLSGKSKDTAIKISEIIKEIHLAVENVLHDIEQTGMIYEDQSTAISEIANEIEVITKSSSDMVELSNLTHLNEERESIF